MPISLALDVSRVEQVLLMDGWHRVATASFELDAYEFIHDGRTVLAGQPTIIPSMGGRWTEPDGSEVACRHRDLGCEEERGDQQGRKGI
jgi:hypothetical protein